MRRLGESERDTDVSMEVGEESRGRRGGGGGREERSRSRNGSNKMFSALLTIALTFSWEMLAASGPQGATASHLEPHHSSSGHVGGHRLREGRSASSGSNDGSGGCQLPESWRGRWFHLGFPQPLQIDRSSINGKGECVKQHKRRNMFLLKESGTAYESCYRCMMIYEKHPNVLQYKESYCEERIDSMESLCHTIAGDAPLYTMFRKDGDLVKCPFRGPFSFSYSKGGRGEVCEYPSSYMDTCSDARRLQLRYQACLDVEGSESAKEQMSCLATWKEGSSRYLVALMNHSHVYTDEARYRCFVYQRQRGQGQGHERGQVVYKMAQSSQASCLGLWSVDEGYKTFTLKKLERDDKDCTFPVWLGRHHDWRSIDGHASLHLNKKGHSLRWRNQTSARHQLSDYQMSQQYGPPHESHVTCHHQEELTVGVTRVVAHVKAGCDSGYVCMVFYSRDKHVIQLRYGAQSRHPSEACMNYYFDPDHSPLITLVANTHNTRPCPFSGRYSLTGTPTALASLLQDPNMAVSCRSMSVVMQAGCSDSADLQIISTCVSGQSSSGPDQSGSDSVANMINDAPAPLNVRSEFACHGKWQAESGKQMLMLSTGSTLLKDNSVSSRHFLCLAYSEQDGVLHATAAKDNCDGSADGDFSRSLVASEGDGGDAGAYFNITSSGPCLQALTGGGRRSETQAFPLFSAMALVALVKLLNL